MLLLEGDTLLTYVQTIITAVTTAVPISMVVSVIGAIIAAIVVPLFVWKFGRKGFAAIRNALSGRGARF